MSTITRRAALVIALALSPALAHAQADILPQGQMTFVVPLAAGGPLDAIARVLANSIGSRLGRTIIIENKAGAGGNIGAASVAKAKPDGLTWLVTIDSVLTVNPHMFKSQGFDPKKDLVTVARAGFFTLALAVNANNVKAKTFAELLSASKEKELSFASAGIGSPGHLAFEFLRMNTGMRGVHVPYRGAAPALQDMVSGAVDAGFVVAGGVLPHVQSGALRALAVSGAQRATQLPNVPTATEAGIKGFEATFYNYVMAPAGIDPKMSALMAEQVSLAMSAEDVRSKFISLGMEPQYGAAAASVAQIAKDRERWGMVLAATVKPSAN